MGEYADLYDEQSLVQELYGMEDPDDMREVSGYNFNEIKTGIRDGD